MESVLFPNGAHFCFCVQKGFTQKPLCVALRTSFGGPRKLSCLRHGRISFSDPVSRKAQIAPQTDYHYYQCSGGAVKRRTIFHHHPHSSAERSPQLKTAGWTSSFSLSCKCRFCKVAHSSQFLPIRPIPFNAKNFMVVISF